MKTISTPYTFDVILLSDTQHANYDDKKGGVYVWSGNKCQSFWNGYLLSELTEEQARSIQKLESVYLPKDHSCLGSLKHQVSKVLQSNGHELRVGERPELENYVGFSIKPAKILTERQAKWDTAYPPERIVLKLKP
jgi:hypothetical protein